MAAVRERRLLAGARWPLRPTTSPRGRQVSVGTTSGIRLRNPPIPAGGNGPHPGIHWSQAEVAGSH